MGDPEGLQRLSAAALRLRRVVFGLWSMAPVVVGLVTVGVVVRGSGPVPPVALAALVSVVAWVAVGWWYVGAAFRSWRWGIDAERFEVRHGVIVRRRMVVPRTRVQHVSTHAGPVQRAFGLVRLEVHTAGARTPNVVVRDLETAAADELRDVLLAERRIGVESARGVGASSPNPPAAPWPGPVPPSDLR